MPGPVGTPVAPGTAAGPWLRQQLAAGEEGPALEAVLQGAGLDPSAESCALALPPEPGLRETVVDLVHRRGGRAVEADQDVLLVQGRPVAPLVDALVPLLRGRAAGIGLRGTGAAAARRSLEQAVSSRGLAARRGRLVRYERAWPMLLLLGGEDQLYDHLLPTIEFARSRPDLAETVRAFSTCRFSITATAQALHLTPNAVVYRLGRWEAATGYDPRSFPGLTCSLACLELIALEDARQAASDGGGPA